MCHFLRFVGISKHEEVPTYHLATYGPLDITDYHKFLHNSKPQFWKRWNHEMKRSKDKLIKLKDKEFSLHDFEKTEFIGRGSFGHVYLVKNKKTNRFHAMKAIRKRTVIETNQVHNTKTEKLLMKCTNCPFTLRLQYFFKDNSYLYFVLPFIQGGTLFQLLQRSGTFDEDSARFYLAQVILAVEYLHYFNFIYRDLKPENVLLDHTGYVKLTDFGFCKKIPSHGRTYTLCGTPDYFAPELLRNEGYGKSVDCWTIGVLAYEMTTGVPPFKEKTEKRKFRRILNVDYRFPFFISEGLKDLIYNTLQEDPSRRFGNMRGGLDDFKKHRWFKPLNWQTVVCRKAKPPFVPYVDAGNDTRHFTKHKYRSLEIANKLEFGQEFADF